MFTWFVAGLEVALDDLTSLIGGCRAPVLLVAFRQQPTGWVGRVKVRATALLAER